MKFWKKKNPSNSEHSTENRDYVAEALEPRILYSGAPVDVEMPDATVEAPTDTDSDADFESTDGFGEEIPHSEAESTLSQSVILTSFDELTEDEIDALARVAIERWQDSDLSEEQLEALELIEFSMLDLDGASLGYAEGSNIFIDSDAAGEGWFVDSTPFEDEEFFLDEDGDFSAIAGSAASDRIDLLSVLQHEIGHVMGLEDIYQSIGRTDVMYGFFEDGERRTILMDQADGVEAFSLDGARYATLVSDPGSTDIVIEGDSDNTAILTVDVDGTFVIDGTDSGILVGDITSLIYTGSGASDDTVSFGGDTAFNFSSAAFIQIGDPANPVREVEFEQSVTLTGDGYFSGYANREIRLDPGPLDAPVSLTTEDGDILLIADGTGGGNGYGFRGTGAQLATVEATGTGSITIEAEGRGINNNRRGALLDNVTLETNTGDLTLIALASQNPAAGTNAEGINFQADGTVTSAGGDIYIYGQGGNSTSATNVRGVNVGSGTISNTAAGGSITVVGKGGAGMTSPQGINIAASGVISNVEGDITLVGSGGTETDGGTGERGIAFGTGASITTTTSGSLYVMGAIVDSTVGGNDIANFDGATVSVAGEVVLYENQAILPEGNIAGILFQSDFENSTVGASNALPTTETELNNGTQVGAWAVGNLQESFIGTDAAVPDDERALQMDQGAFEFDANLSRPADLSSGVGVSFGFARKTQNVGHTFDVVGFDSTGTQEIFRIRMGEALGDTVHNLVHVVESSGTVTALSGQTTGRLNSDVWNPGSSSVEDFAIEITASGFSVKVNNVVLSDSSSNSVFSFNSPATELSTVRFESEGNSGAWLDEVAVVGVEETTYSFDDDTVEVTEGDAGITQATFTVNRTGADPRASTVNYTVSTGSADSDDVDGDLPITGTVFFAAGETSKTLTIPIAGDAVFEYDETLSVALSDPSLGSIAGGAGTLTILNDDAPTVVYVEDIDWNGFSNGQVIADADFGTGDAEPAVFGVNAFSSFADALEAVTADGTIIVNSGDYNGTVEITGGRTLKVTGSTTPGTVEIADLIVDSASFVEIEGDSTLVVETGDISGVISGDGNLTKEGNSSTDTLHLRGDNTYSGTTTVNRGILQIAHSNALGSTGADSKTIVNGNDASSGARLQIRTSNALTIAETIHFNANSDGRATLNVSSSAVHTFTGPIDVSSTGNIVQFFSSGAGAVTITGDITGTMTNNVQFYVRGNSTNAQNQIAGSLNLTGGRLSKTDTGTWTIGAAGKTYDWDNGTLISVGTLRMGLSNIIPAGTVLLGQNSALDATFDLNNTNQTVTALQLRFNDTSDPVEATGKGTVETGTGILTLNGNLSYTGTAGLVNDVNSINGNLDLGGAARTFTINDGGQEVDLRIDAKITNGSITKTGAGNLVLGGDDNNTSLSATVSGGSLVLAKGASGSAIDGFLIISNGAMAQLDNAVNTNQISAASDVTINGTGVFDLNGQSESFDQLQGDGTVTNTGATDAVLTVGEDSSTATFAGIIEDGAGGATVALEKIGDGDFNLTNANTYTGETTISEGRLSVTDSDALGTGLVNMGGGILRTVVDLANDISLDDVTTATSNTIEVDGNYRVLSGQISGAGGLTVAGVDGGVNADGLALANSANDFQGDVTITGSNVFLRLDADEVIPDTSSVFVDSGGKLRLEGDGRTETIAGLSGSGRIFASNSGTEPTLRVGFGDADGEYSGQIGGGGDNNKNINLEKIGGGILTLSGTNSDFIGTTTVSSGTLRLGSDAALGATTGNTVISDGATLDLNGQSIGAGETIEVRGAGVGDLGAIINSSSSTSTVSGTIDQNNFTVGGNGTIDFAGAVTADGGRILTKVGVNTLILSGAVTNDFVLLDVDAGIVELAKSDDSANAVNRINDIASGAKVIITGAGTDQILGTANEGRIKISLGGVFDLNGHVESIDRLESGTGGGGEVTNTSTQAAELIVGQSDGITVFSGTFTQGVGAGALSLTKVGTNRMVITGGNGDNSYTGLTKLVDGTFEIGDTGFSENLGILGDILVEGGTFKLKQSDIIADTSNLTVNTGATFDQSNRDETLASLSGGGDLLLASVGSLTLAGLNGSDFAGEISGAGKVTISGASTGVTQTFSGVNSYTGETLVTGGTLLVNGTHTGGRNYTVSSGAVLGGDGTITLDAGRQIIINNGGTIATGDSAVDGGVGTLTVSGDVNNDGTIKINSDIIFQIDGTDSDQLDVTGTVKLDGNADLNLVAVTVPVAGASYTLISNDGTEAVIGNFTTVAEGSVVSDGTNSYRVFYGGGDGNDVVLVENTAPSVVYVDDDFTGNGGQVIADGDLGTDNSQEAIFGVTAFTNLTDALAAVAVGGTVIVNDGTYLEDITLADGKTIEITGPDADVEVTIRSIANTDDTAKIIIEGDSTLVIGDTVGAVNSNIAGVISGTGGLVKQAAGILLLQGENLFTGDLTLNAGTLRAENHTAGNTSTVLGVGDLKLNGGSLELAAEVSTDFSNTNSATIGGDVTIVTDRLTAGGNLTHTLADSLTIGANTLTLEGGSFVTSQFVGLNVNQVILTGNATFNPNGTRNAVLSVAGVSEGDGNSIDNFTITKTGNRILNLQGGTYDFLGTNMQSGTLRAVGTDSLQNTTTISGGTLELRNSSNGARVSDLVFTGDANLRLPSNNARTFTTNSITVEDGVTMNVQARRINTVIADVSHTLTVTDGITTGDGSIIQFTQVDGYDTIVDADITTNGDVTLNTDGADMDVLILGSVGDGTTADGDIIKVGTGNLTFSGNNTYMGDTLVNEGTLLLIHATDDNIIDTSPTVTVASGATLDVTGLPDGEIVVANGQTLQGEGTVLGEISGAVGSNVSPGLTGTVDPGTLTVGKLDLTTGNTFTVDLTGTTVGTGYDQLVVNDTTPGNVVLTGSTLDVQLSFPTAAGDTFVIIDNDDADTVSGTFAGLPEDQTFEVTSTLDGLRYVFQIHYNTEDGTAAGNNVVLESLGVAETSVEIDVNGNLVITDINGGVSDDDITISEDGAGNYIITDPNLVLATSISGATRIDGNTISVSKLLVAGGLIVNTEGDDGLDPATDVVTFGGSNSISFAGDIVINSETEEIVLEQDVTSSTGDVTFNGPVIVGTSSTVTSTAGDIVFESTLDLGGAGNTLTVDVFDTGSEIKGSISGAGDLAKDGDGTVTLSGANTYAGLTTVADGILKLNHATALGATTGVVNTVVQNGGALDLNGFNQINERIEINGPGSGAADTGALFNSAASMSNNGVRYLSLGSDASVGNDGGRFGLNSGTISGAFTLTKVGNNDIWLSSNVQVANIVVDNGVYGIQGSNADNVSGSITVNENGTLATWRVITIDAPLNIIDGRFRTGGSVAGENVTLNSDITLTGNNNRFETSSNVSAQSNGAISGTGSLVKTGGGVLTFAGTDDTYTGTTTVSAGTLLVNGSHDAGAGNYTVSGGAVLGGTGTIITTGAVTVDGILATGDPGTAGGIGELTVDGDITINSQFQFDIDGATSDTLNVTVPTEEVTLGGTSTLVVTDPTDPGAGTTILVIDNEGVDAINGVFTSDGTTPLAEGATVESADGNLYTISYVGIDGNDVVLFEGEAETNVDLSGGILTISDITNENADAITISYDSVNEEYVITDPGQVLKTSNLTVGQFIRPDAHTVRVKASLVTSVVVETENPTVATETDTVTISSLPADIDGAVTVNAENINVGSDIVADAITLNGDVTLTADVVFDTEDVNGNINVNGTIDGTFDLEINNGTGTTTVTGAVGGTTALDEFTVRKGSTTLQAGLTADDLSVAAVTDADPVPATASLTVSAGAVMIGDGDGEVNIATRDASYTANSTAISGTVDFSGASGVTIDVTAVNMGTITSTSSFEGGALGSLELSDAGNNEISATTFIVADSPARGNGGVSTVGLGGAANNFNVDTLTLGGRKGQATMTIESGGTLTLTGDANSAADLNIGINVTGNTGTTSRGNLDLTGGTFNATIDDLKMGGHSTGASGIGDGTLTFEAGTVTADTVALGVGNLNADATINQRGGTFTVANGVTEDSDDGSFLNIENGSFTVTAGGLEVDRLTVGYTDTSDIGELTNTASLAVSGGDVRVGIGAASGLDMLVGVNSASSAPPAVGAIDFTAASTVTIDVDEIQVGRVSTTNGAGTYGEIDFSNVGTNTVTANAIRVGDSPSPNNTGVTSTITFGSMTSDVNVDLFEVGVRKSLGTVDIASGGTLNLSGNLNTEADLRIGYNSAGGTGTAAVGRFDMSGGTFNGAIDELILGHHFGNNGVNNGQGDGFLIIDAGTTTVTTGTISEPNGNGSTSRPDLSSGEVTINGGSITFATLDMGTGTSVYNQNGGTTTVTTVLNLAGEGGTSGTVGDSTFNLVGGTLDMSDVNVVDLAGTETFNFAGGTLKDANNFGIPLTQAGGTLQFGDGSEVDEMTVQGDFTTTGGTTEFTLNGDTSNDILHVVGEVTLGNALNLEEITAGMDSVPLGTTITLIENDGSTDAVTGIFTGLPEGSVVTDDDGDSYVISYIGNDGNDVVLYAGAAETEVSFDTAGNLVVTDINGDSADSLTVVEHTLADGTKGILITDTDLVLSTLGTDGRFPATGITRSNAHEVFVSYEDQLFSGGVIVNTANGADNGTDSVTIGNLDLDANNKAGLEVNAENITITGAVKTAAGDVDLNSRRQIDMADGASVVTTSGNVTFGAIPAINGGNQGIDLQGNNTIQTESGDITLTGQAADTGTSNRDGVRIREGGLITSNTGEIQITGTGTGTEGGNRGVRIFETATVRTVNGDLFITGDGGGGTLNNNQGILVQGTVESTGSGNLSLTGTGGGTTSNANHGIFLNNADATVRSTGTGTITLNGTGGDATGNNKGVFIVSDATVESSAGAISITGQGGGLNSSNNTNNNDGLFLQGSIIATGTATVTIIGNAGGAQGANNDFNAGVEITGPDASISSEGGAISITGVGGGAGASNDSGSGGVQVIGGAQITSTGSAAITITGTAGADGGQDTDDDDGVLISGAGTVISHINGNIDITGTGEDGVELTDSATITVSGTGAIHISGESTNPDLGANNRIGAQIDSAITSGTGDVTIESVDHLVFSANGDVSSTSGTVTITADKDNLTNGGEVVMDNGALIAAGTGDIDLNSGGDMTLGGLAAGGTVTVDSTNGDLNVGEINAVGNVTLNAGDDFTLDAGGFITSGSGQISITVDPGAADGEGGIVTLAGEVSAANQVFITGGNDADIFNITPSANSVINVNGGAPSYPETVGDVLNINNGNNPQRNEDPVVENKGYYLFGGGQQQLNYIDIELDNVPTLEIDIPISQRLHPTTLNGEFTDFGLDDGHVLTVDWKNGTSTFDIPSFSGGLSAGDVIASTTDGAQLTIVSADPTTGKVEFTVSHTYETDGLYEVEVSVVDSTAARAEASQVAQVYFLAPSGGNPGYFSDATLPGQFTLNGYDGLFTDLSVESLFVTDESGYNLTSPVVSQPARIFFTLGGEVRVVFLTGVENEPEDILAALNNSLLRGTPLDLLDNVLPIDEQEVLQMIAELIRIDVDGVES